MSDGGSSFITVVTTNHVKWCIINRGFSAAYSNMQDSHSPGQPEAKRRGGEFMIFIYSFSFNCGIRDKFDYGLDFYHSEILQGPYKESHINLFIWLKERGAVHFDGLTPTCIPPIFKTGRINFNPHLKRLNCTYKMRVKLLTQPHLYSLGPSPIHFKQ